MAIIQDILGQINAAVGSVAQSGFTQMAGAAGNVLTIGGIVVIAAVGLNIVLQIAPLQISASMLIFFRMAMISFFAQSWANFAVIFDILSKVPSSIGASVAKLAGMNTSGGLLVVLVRIRQSLLLLSSREVVELLPNRGAFVASPSAEQAREVFETRLMIEPNVARLAAERASDADLTRLGAHLQLEHQAHHSSKRRDAIRLSGQFHVLLAEVAGNSVALRMVKELVTRTSLIIGIFGSPGVSNCRDEDHDEIFTAFQTRNSDLAARLMEDHLRHIQEHLELGGRTEASSDLVAIFRK